jgi:molecular chaperone GrpE
MKNSADTKKKVKDPIAPKAGIQNKKKDKAVHDLENKLKTALSDYQNLKRDLDKRLDFEEVMIRKSVLRELISLSDDIDMALEQMNPSVSEESGASQNADEGLRSGMTHILSKFYKIIENIGGEVIEVKVGDIFDSEKHEAISTTTEGKPGTVANVVQNGYKLGDVVVRPTRVVVVKKSTEK